MARTAGTLSLRTRLLWLLALSAAGLVLVATYSQLRIAGAAVERELLDAASAAALGVAAEIAERPELPSAEELEDIRASYAQALPELEALSIVERQGDAERVATTTESSPPPEVLRLAAQASASRELVVSAALDRSRRVVAVPLERDRRSYGALAVTMSMARVDRVRREMRRAAFVIAPIAIAALTGVIWLVGSKLVHRPLESIHDTMHDAAAGNLDSRARVYRRDELGRLAEGLNAMLDRMRDFNATLQQEVAHATRELSDRNALLADSSLRLFAARRELARAEQLAVAGRMAAAVAHKVGTPLNLISGYVQMLLEQAPVGSAQRARLTTVREQIERVTAIVQGLLDQARQPALRRAPIAPALLVERVVDLARPTLERAGIVLETRIEPELEVLDLDVGQIEQVFLNLITNAVDAMPDGGRLGISARRSEAGVEFEVSDSGVGIRPEDHTRVFDPLFTTKEPGKGTGLGLTIVRDVLAAHAGSVELRSEPGRGTTVRIRLPRGTREGTGTHG